MKKNLKISFVFFILTGLATVATAQAEKGNFLLSGSGSLDFALLSLKLKNDNTSEDVGKISDLEFTPGAGYFITSLDFILGYAGATAKIKDYQNVEWKTTANGFGGSIGFSIIF